MEKYRYVGSEGVQDLISEFSQTEVHHGDRAAVNNGQCPAFHNGTATVRSF